MRSEFDHVLNLCTARVTVDSGNSTGTAFFVAPGYLLTCAHVVTDEDGVYEGPILICWQGMDAEVHVNIPYFPSPYPDLALLKIDLEAYPTFSEHPCVFLDENASILDNVYSYGYTELRPLGDPLTASVEGWAPFEDMSDDREVIKLKEGQIVPGLSGAPLLNLRTGGVCGVIKRTRDSDSTLGGIAVPTSTVLKHFDFLTTAQKAYHQSNLSWMGEGPLLGFTNAHELPPNYISRDDELNRLRQVIFSSPPASITAIQGMPGVGKTVLAQALCYDKAVRGAFPDGIIWVTIGRELEDLLPRLQQANNLLGDKARYYDTIEVGELRLRELAQRKKALIVLDDVWHNDQVKPFLVNAPDYRVVVTTRDSNIALALGSPQHHTKVMALEQAVALLRKWAMRDDPYLESVAEQLGYLPLALKIAGIRLREGISGEEWLANFQKVSQIKQGYRSTRPQDNLEVCFDLSLNSLAAEERSLYLSLGVFSEDAVIPQATISRLWRQLRPNLTPHDCGELIQELARHALLELGIDRSVTMHDLLHAYCREKSGGALRTNQEALMAAYKSAGLRWSEITDDGYIYNHLTWHLEDAGRLDELKTLLSETSDEGRNGWFVARAQAGQTLGFLNDVSRALRLAEDKDSREAESARLPPSLADEVRYALYRSSVSGLTADFPPEVLRAFVNHGLWSIDAAIEKVHQFPEASLRIDGLCALAESTDAPKAEELLKEALALLPEVPGSYERDEKEGALLRLLVHQGFASAALGVVKRMEDSRVSYVAAALIPLIKDQNLIHEFFDISKKYRGSGDSNAPYTELEILLALLPAAPSIREQVCERAVEVASRIRHGSYTIGEAYVKLAEYLPDDGKASVLDEAITSLLKLAHTESFVSTITSLALYLTAQHRNLVLAAIEKSFYPDERAKVALSMLRVFSEEERAGILSEILKYIRGFDWPEHQVKGLVIIANALTDEHDVLWQEAIQLTSDLSEPVYHDVLLTLSLEANEQWIGTVCDLVKNISDEAKQLQIFSELLTQRSSSQIRQHVIQAARQLTQPKLQSKLLIEVARQINDDGRYEILNEALERTCHIDDRVERAQIELDILDLFTSLANHRAIYDELYRVSYEVPSTDGMYILRRLAKIAPVAIQVKILKFCFSTDDLSLRYSLLQALAPRLSTTHLKFIEVSSGRINDGLNSLNTRRSLDVLSDTVRESAPDDEIKDAAGREGACVKFRQAVTKAVLQMVLSGEIELMYIHGRNISLKVLAVHMSYARESKSAIKAIANIKRELADYTFKSAVRDCAPLLPQEAVIELVDMIRHKVRNPIICQKRLFHLLPFLPPKYSSQIVYDSLKLVKEDNDTLDPEYLALLAQHTEGGQRECLARLAAESFFSHPNWGGEETWVAMAPILTDAQLSQAENLIDTLCSKELKMHAILSLAPFMPEVLQYRRQMFLSVDKQERAEIFAQHIHRFEDSRAREDVMQGALDAAYSLNEQLLRANALLEVATELDGALRSKTISYALSAILEERYDNRRKAELNNIVPHLCTLHPATVYELWREALRKSSQRDRPNFFEDIQALGIVTYYLGGQDAIEGTVGAIRDVTRWWP